MYERIMKEKKEKFMRQKLNEQDSLDKAMMEQNMRQSTAQLPAASKPDPEELKSPVPDENPY